MAPSGKSSRQGETRRGLIAAAVVTLIAIPESLAFTEAARLPLAAGLWSLFLPPIMYWLLKSSGRVALGLSGPVAVLIAAGNEGLSPGAALAHTSVVTLVVAALFAAAGALRLGFLARLVSRPILEGLALGTFFVLVSLQLGDLLGTEVVGHSALSRFASAVHALPRIRAPTLAIEAATVGLLIVGRWRWGRVGSGALALLGAVLLVAFSGWGRTGQVEVVGPLSTALPHPYWSGLSWGAVVELLPVASAVFVLLAIESIELGRGLAMRESGRGFDLDGELLRLSATNVVAALALTLPIAGSVSATTAEDRTKGASRHFALIPSLCAGALLLVGHEFRNLPRAAVALVALSAMATLLRPKELIRVARFDPRELALALLALGVTVAFGPVSGVLLATGVSALLLVRWASQSRLTPSRVRASDPPGREGVLSLQLQGAFIMLNAEAIVQQIEQHVTSPRRAPEAMLLDFSAVPTVDFTAVEALRGLAAELQRRGVPLLLVGAAGATGAALQRAGFELTPRSALIRADDVTEREGQEPPADRSPS